MSSLKVGNYIYYEVYGHKMVGEILFFLEDGSFVVSANPTTRMPQMDDSRRSLKPSDEGKLFWLYPTPEQPIPIEIQQEMQRRNK